MTVEPNSPHEDAILRMVYGDAVSTRMYDWLSDQKLTGKVRVGVVAFRKMDTGEIIARAKVLPYQGGYFYHDEPYDDFPSDHFKTKIILVTGGA